MANLTASGQDELTFLTGIDQTGSIAADTYFTYNVEGFGFDPARAYLSKWYNDSLGSPIASTSKAGTPGGTVTYAFDSSVGIQAQAAYTASLTLWSNVANIQFKQVSSLSTASLRIENTPTDNGDTFVPANGFRVPGTGVTDLPTQMAPNARGGQASIKISADDSNFNNFSPGASNLMGTVVHETGHAIGLGHAGRYNGSLDYAGQRGMYDSRQWSVMSYINPDDPNATFATSYTVQGTKWTTPTSRGGVGGEAQTPMPLDILAAQRLYGASTSTTFSGGQVYGFNNTISDASRVFYDFTTNQSPIVTLYNTGTNNTLDVSGFAKGSRIDLNPGTFSSASASGALVNNIGIAFDTRIDAAIGGAGNDTFRLNSNGDRIDGGAGRDTAILKGTRADYTVLDTGLGVTTVTNTSTGVTDTLTNIEDIQFEGPLCFTSGTRIRLVRNGVVGDVPVEALRVGDVAVTAAGDHRRIRWIGHRTVEPVWHPVPSRHFPVRIRAGAFGLGLPVRDLRLSAGHPVLVGADADGEGGVLVPVMCLINGTSLAREPVDSVTYWHVELDAHDILLADGLPAESYLDLGCRAYFADESDHPLHSPDFVPPGLSGRCRPVVTDGALVKVERERLAAVFAAELTGQCAWSVFDPLA